MTRDEYLEMLATEPATGAQVGAILVEFGRLGVDDRGERLAISAALLGLDSLDSTTDLVMGDGGKLVAMLRRVRDRAELLDIAPPGKHQDDDEHQYDEPGGMSIADVLLALAELVMAACANRAAANRNEVGQHCQQIRST